MNMLRSLLIAMVATTLHAAHTTVLAEEAVPRTGVYVLVDASETWLTKPAHVHNEFIIRQTVSTIMEMAAKSESPIAVFVVLIGANSILQRPLCEAVYKHALIGGTGTPGEFRNKDKLRNYLDLCLTTILARAPEKWTDIHGALDLVSRLSQVASIRRRYLIVLSDFKEERPKGPLPSVRLDGFHVGMIYRVLPEDSVRPQALNDRLNYWSSAFKKYGAARTVFAIDKAKFASDITLKLLQND
jgi:hypothetical protein